MVTIFQAVTLGGYALVAGGAALCAYGLIPRRSTRSTCPKCGYDLEATDVSRSAVPKCPECGTTAKGLGALYRLRIRRGTVLLGLLVALLSNGLFSLPRIARSGWIGAVPTSALTALVPFTTVDHEPHLFFESRKPDVELRLRESEGELLAPHRWVWMLRTGAAFWWDGGRWGMKLAENPATTATSNSPTRANSRSVLSFYATGDISATEALEKAIQSHITPEDWFDNGGDAATIGAIGETLCIVAPPTTHARLGELLAAVRKPTPTPWAGVDARDVHQSRGALARLMTTPITMGLSHVDMAGIAGLIASATGVRIAYEEASLGRARVNLERLMRLGRRHHSAATLLDAAMVALPYYGGDVPVWSIRGDHILIASGSEQIESLSVVYDVHELVDRATRDHWARSHYRPKQGEESVRVVELLSEVIASEEWHVNGGDRIGESTIGDHLVISAPLRRHVEIEEFLRKLLAATSAADQSKQ